MRGNMGKRRKPDSDEDEDRDGGGGGGGAAMHGGFGFGLQAKRHMGMSTRGVGFGNGNNLSEGDGAGGSVEDEGQDGADAVFSFMPPSNMSIRRAEFVQYLKALNGQFAAWINTRMSGSGTDGVACELWIDGAKDYIKHAMKIKEDFKDVLDDTSTGMSVGLNQGSLPEDKKTLFGAKPPVPSYGTQQNGRTEEKDQKTFQLFGVGGKPSFGEGNGKAGEEEKTVKQKPELVNPVAKAGGLFGTSIQSGGFSFGSGLNTPLANPVSATTEVDTAVGAAANDEDEPQRPSSPSVLDANDDIVFSSKAKMYVQSRDADGKIQWKDLGVGELSVRKDESSDASGSDKKKARLCLRNTGGKLRLNSNIYKGIKVSNKLFRLRQ